MRDYQSLKGFVLTGEGPEGMQEGQPISHSLFQSLFLPVSPSLLDVRFHAEMFRIIRNQCFGSAWYSFFSNRWDLLLEKHLRPLTKFCFMDERGDQELVSWRFPNACFGSSYNAEPLLLSVREKREYLSKHSSRFPSRLFRGKQQVDLITRYDVWPGGLSLEMLSSYFLSWAVAFGSSIILPPTQMS